ncbi:hypothetical protein EGX94_01205 [Propionibacterium acidifaciens]|nr:hypothetical protein EGX94_01205 [Propionibacterium acidifaciens]
MAVDADRLLLDSSDGLDLDVLVATAAPAGDRPLETGEVLLLTCRGAFVLALAGLIGASLAVIAMSVSVAVIILALCFGLGQMLATMVPALFSGGRFALIAPDWANTILLGAWLE